MSYDTLEPVRRLEETRNQRGRHGRPGPDSTRVRVLQSSNKGLRKGPVATDASRTFPNSRRSRTRRASVWGRKTVCEHPLVRPAKDGSAPPELVPSPPLSTPRYDQTLVVEPDRLAGPPPGPALPLSPEGPKPCFLSVRPGDFDPAVLPPPRALSIP